MPSSRDQVHVLVSNRWVFDPAPCTCIVRRIIRRIQKCLHPFQYSAVKRLCPRNRQKQAACWRTRKTAQCRCYVLIKRRFPSYLRTGQRAALREHREHREQEALKHRRDETETGSCSLSPTHPPNLGTKRETHDGHAAAARSLRAPQRHKGTHPPPSPLRLARQRRGLGRGT